MGILSRFKDIMASNVNAIFKKGEKYPEKELEKYLSQLRSDLGQVKAETAALETEVRRAQRAVDENTDEAEKMKRYIAKAQENGSSSDVRTYERKLEDIETEGQRLNEKYLRVSSDMEKLSGMNQKLESDIQTLEQKMTEIKSKLTAAKAQEEMNKMSQTAGAKNSDEMFERMNEKADYMLDRANAMAELDSDNTYTDYDEIERLADKYDDK